VKGLKRSIAVKFFFANDYGLLTAQEKLQSPLNI